jgi:hypothetical protein
VNGGGHEAFVATSIQVLAARIQVFVTADADDSTESDSATLVTSKRDLTLPPRVV